MIKKETKLDQILIKLTEHDKRFEQMDKRFDDVDKKLGRVFDKLIDHDQKFDAVDQKMADKFDQVLTGLDKISGEQEKVREDQRLALEKDRKQDRDIENLAGRVKVLEDAKV